MMYVNEWLEFQRDLKERPNTFERRSHDLLKYECVEHINAKGMVVGIVFDTTERTNKAAKRKDLTGTPDATVGKLCVRNKVTKRVREYLYPLPKP